MKIRLESYHKQITQFDCLDKTLSNSFKNPKIISLANPAISLDRSFLKNFLIIEAVFNKNLKLNYFKHKKLSPSVSTLHGKDLFIFLDFAFSCCINIKTPKNIIKQQPLLLSSVPYNHFSLPLLVKLTIVTNWVILPNHYKQLMHNFSPFYLN